MFFSMPGQADLTALKSRTFVSWALLNWGTHCNVLFAFRQIIRATRAHDSSDGDRRQGQLALSLQRELKDTPASVGLRIHLS